MSALTGRKFSQVGYIVKNIEEARVKYAQLLGVEVPPANPCGVTEHSKTVFRGEPAPNAASKLAFFDLSEGVQLELIEPNEYPSTWREYLNEKGEGIHHIAFIVEDMEQAIADCEAEGMTLVQYGNYDDNSGRYAYMDGNKDYKCVIELLQNF